MINQDILENQVKPIYIGVGSNLGNRVSNIEKTKFYLNYFGLKIINKSNYYETLSWPNPKDPKFLNIVLAIETDLLPTDLIKVLKKIETKLGRTKNKKNSPRECDIDIIDYKGKIISSDLVIPHKRMHLRNFVLFPLYEINKKWKHPKYKINIKKLIFSLSNKDIRSIKKY